MALMFEWYRSTLGKPTTGSTIVTAFPVLRWCTTCLAGRWAVPSRRTRRSSLCLRGTAGSKVALPVTRVVPLANLGQGTVKYSYCVDELAPLRQWAPSTLAQNQQVYSDTGINSTALSALAQAA